MHATVRRRSHNTRSHSPVGSQSATWWGSERHVMSADRCQSASWGVRVPSIIRHYWSLLVTIRHYQRIFAVPRRQVAGGSALPIGGVGGQDLTTHLAAEFMAGAATSFHSV
jgi:hypothetical protein